MRFVLLACIMMTACGSARTGRVLDTPVEAARHRAALAMITAANATDAPLTIAFRTAAPPLQVVVIGRVGAGETARLAPVPSGEPITLIARRADGAEFTLAPRLFSLDSEWTWEIPRDAIFVRQENAE